jgi:hypothetical protein
MPTFEEIMKTGELRCEEELDQLGYKVCDVSTLPETDHFAKYITNSNIHGLYQLIRKSDGEVLHRMLGMNYHSYLIDCIDNIKSGKYGTSN